MEIRDRIKKRLGDIAMQDNVHYKRWQQNEQKKRDLDQQMKETLSKIKHVEKENNLMWQEIHHIKEVMPDQGFRDIDFEDRGAFYKDGVTQDMARGDHVVPKDLSTVKKYRGPLIQPLVPNYVADKLSYKDTVNITKLTDMELFKKHHELAMKKGPADSRAELDGFASAPRTGKHLKNSKMPPLNPVKNPR